MRARTEILPPGWENDDWSHDVPTKSGLLGASRLSLCCAMTPSPRLTRPLVVRRTHAQGHGSPSKATCCRTATRITTRTTRASFPLTCSVRTLLAFAPPSRVCAELTHASANCTRAQSAAQTSRLSTLRRGGESLRATSRSMTSGSGGVRVGTRAPRRRTTRRRRRSRGAKAGMSEGTC